MPDTSRRLTAPGASSHLRRGSRQAGRKTSYARSRGYLPGFGRLLPTPHRVRGRVLSDATLCADSGRAVKLHRVNPAPPVAPECIHRLLGDIIDETADLRRVVRANRFDSRVDQVAACLILDPLHLALDVFSLRIVER